MTTEHDPLETARLLLEQAGMVRTDERALRGVGWALAAMAERLGGIGERLGEIEYQLRELVIQGRDR